MKYKNEDIKKLIKSGVKENILLAIELMVAKKFPINVFRQYMKMGYRQDISHIFWTSAEIIIVNDKYLYFISDKIIPQSKESVKFWKKDIKHIKL